MITGRGSSITLSCETNIPFSFCAWRGPSRQCTLRQNQQGNSQHVCSGGAVNELIVKGNQTNCIAEVNHVYVSDFGTWQCILTDVNSQTDKAEITVEVAQPAHVKFCQSPDQHSCIRYSRRFLQKEKSKPYFGYDNSLTITEGDQVSVSNTPYSYLDRSPAFLMFS